MSLAGEQSHDLTAAIAALRARGAARVDPVRLRQAEAMVRRVAAHQGEARRLLNLKLAALLARLDRALDTRAAAATAAVPVRHRGPLAELLAELASDGSEPGAGQASAAGSTWAQPVVELKALRDHRSTWTRLGVDQRMRQSLATVPDQAGPLNTQRLMHEALTAMRDASPECLQRFIAQVEALLWLDQASLPSGASRKKDAARTHRQR